MISSVDLDELYKSYGFIKLETGHVNVNAYSLQTGHFLNADIVPLNKELDASVVKLMFDESGYASTIRSYLDIDAADIDLFKGFFAAESSRLRLAHDYKKYTQNICSRLNVPYEYIPTPYEIIPTHSLNDTSVFSPSDPLIEHLKKIFELDGPCLILLEAAAGYGKTCTSYEVINDLINYNENVIPILTELSRNRTANTFRYVLLDEIDINFPTLNSNLVKHQIFKGRIPVIVDGFDELLRKSNDIDEKFEEVEPMLHTISDMLDGNAKVLVTTRRTAIFTDDEFYNWVENQSDKFSIYRFSIDKPTIKDWLGPDKIRKLESSNLPIAQLSNPVLLSYLRSLEYDEFAELCDQPGTIVHDYIKMLLEREQERQNLKMSVDEQKEVFYNLAADMVKEDFTAETMDYIQLRVLDRNDKLLSECRLNYSSTERPTLEELATKLSSHALLDRRHSDDHRVGFVNDFIFGTFIGDNILADNTGDWIASELYFDLAVTAFIPRSEDERLALWKNLKGMLDIIDGQRKLSTDIYLTGECTHDIKDSSFDLLQLNGCKLGFNKTIFNSIFHDCIFRDVTFMLDSFNNVTFSNCRFYDCLFISKNKLESVHIIACEGDLDELYSIITSNQSDVINNIDELLYFETAVLERFWPKGKAHYVGRKAIRTLYLGVGHNHHKEISSAIQNLKKKEILNIFSGYVELNADKLSEIKIILGRN